MKMNSNMLMGMDPEQEYVNWFCHKWLCYARDCRDLPLQQMFWAGPAVKIKDYIAAREPILAAGQLTHLRTMCAQWQILFRAEHDRRKTDRRKVKDRRQKS